MANRSFYWNGSVSGNWLDDDNWEDENGDPVSTSDKGPGYAAGDPASPDNNDAVYFLASRLSGGENVLSVGVNAEPRYCTGGGFTDRAYAALRGANEINPNGGSPITFSDVVLYGSMKVVDGFGQPWGTIKLYDDSTSEISEDALITAIELYNGDHEVDGSAAASTGFPLVVKGPSVTCDITGVTGMVDVNTDMVVKRRA